MQKLTDVVLDKNGRPIQGAVVTLATYPDGLPATIYASDGGPAVPSVKTNSAGRFELYAANGHYSATITGTGFASVVLNDIILYDPSGLGAPTGSGLVGYGGRTVKARLDEAPSIKDDGAVGNGVTDDLAAANITYPKSNEIFFPAGNYVFSAKPSGFSSKRRIGPGVVTIQGQGNVYPDSDILRYDPNGDSASDYSIRLTRNRADLNTDQTKNGFYFYQNYTSQRATSSLFGFAANVKRAGGGAKVVPFQANGYAVDGGSQSVWGIATEAWTGDSTAEGSGSCSLIGAEFAVHSQYHANTSKVIGADHVFYNKVGSGGDVLHGDAGSNQFNKNSVAVQISTGFNEGRPASGAYNGWNTGIYFGSNSLDQSVDRKAYGIDMGDVLASRLAAAIRVPNGAAISMGKVTSGGGVEDGFVYVDDGSRRRIELRRDVLGSAPVTALILDMSSTGPIGTVMAYDQISTTVGAAGAAAALPSAPAKYIRVRDGGITYKIPLYNV